MNKLFTISSAYEWAIDEKRKSSSELAIKTITEHIKNRFSNNENEMHNYKINYRRLRASAGRTMLDSIKKRIETSNVVIIDITSDNKNVYIEAGIALTIEQTNKNMSVYFIREKKHDVKLPHGIPSDLQGYFISEYVLEKEEKVVFKDNNSLRMSIESDVKDYYNSIDQDFNPIDEIFEYDDK